MGLLDAYRRDSFGMKIKINATNQTCPADVLAIFMGGRKIGEGVLRGLQKGGRR